MRGVVRSAGAWLLFAVVAGLPGHAVAQLAPEFDLRVGPAVPINDFSHQASAGAFLAGTLFANISKPFSLGLEFGGNFGHSDTTAGTTTDTTILQVTPVARLATSLPGGGLIYLLTGAGFYRVDYEYSGTVTGGSTENDFGFNLGGGVLFPIGKHSRIGLDLRYHHLFESGVNPEYLVPGVVLTYTP